MATHTLNLSDDLVSLLMSISDKMGIPPEIDSISERIEIVIDVIANSVDAGFEVDSTDADGPIQMEDAVNTLINPDISTNFINPAPVPTAGNVELAFDELMEKMYGADGPSAEQEVNDPTVRRALEIVFNQLPQDEWTSEHAERLIEETVALIQSGSGQRP